MRKIITILDGDVYQRTRLTLMLQGTYSVQAYGNMAAALLGMQLDWPSLILLGPQVGGSSGISVAHDLKRDRRLSGVPVLYIADKEDTRLREQLQQAGVKAILVRPIEESILSAFVGKLINAEVELGWRDLPLHQRKTLEGTLSAFNGITRELAAGKPPLLGPLTDACSSLIEAMAREEFGPLLEKIRNHDNFTYVHSMRYSAFMALFARAIGLSKELQIQVACGGLLHDMGMMTIAPRVLNKHGPLSPSEWKMVRDHVSMGERLLQAMGPVGKGVQIIVSQHHERLDGSGYPNGLKSSQLNELARMAGIIDVFCGLTDHRPYRAPLSAHAALEMMATSMSRQLDCDLLPRFRDILLDSAYAQFEFDVTS